MVVVDACAELSQVCRDCGQSFAYDPDADRCESCVARALGEPVGTSLAGWPPESPDSRPVCFSCGERRPLVEGHRVCERCHGSHGVCGRCGYMQPDASGALAPVSRRQPARVLG